METLSAFYEEHPHIVVGVAGFVALSVTHMTVKKLFSVIAEKQRAVDAPPNTVVLVQLPRGPYAPSLSPFPLKLETFLRMANVPYKNKFGRIMSKKNKTPFMVYNGEEVADSQFCIEYLNKKLGLDMNKDLTKEQRAVAKAIQILVDEHLYWCLVYLRWIVNPDKEILKMVVPWLIRRYAQRMVIGQLRGQGIGRHSHEEIVHILMTDLQTLTDYLGNKPFMMGANPCEVDCSVLGLLAQLVWHSKGCAVCENLLQDKFPSLYQYCLRMKERFWPDWDECNTNGQTKKATK